MADPRTQYRSSFRNLRADGGAATPPSVSYPQPGRSRPFARTQAEALQLPETPVMMQGVQGAQWGPGTGSNAWNAPASAPAPAPSSAPAASEAPAASALPIPPMWDAIGKEGRAAVGNAYGVGGFDAISKMEGWYDVPEWARTQILEGVGGY